MAVTFDAVRALALALEGTEEGTSYGTPAFRVGGKMFARLHQDGETLVVKVDLDARPALIEARPDAFFITEHYLGYPMMLVRLAVVKRAELARVLEDAWRMCAPRGKRTQG